MSFDKVRQVINELSVVANSDKEKAEMARIQQQNLELSHKINTVNEENMSLMIENSSLKERANLNDAEIQRRVEILSTSNHRRWLVEEMPAIIQQAVGEEIRRYPDTCSSNTKQLIEAEVQQGLQQKMREAWYPIFFALSDGFRQANKQVATSTTGYSNTQGQSKSGRARIIRIRSDAES